MFSDCVGTPLSSVLNLIWWCVLWTLSLASFSFCSIPGLGWNCVCIVLFFPLFSDLYVTLGSPLFLLPSLFSECWFLQSFGECIVHDWWCLHHWYVFSLLPWRIHLVICSSLIGGPCFHLSLSMIFVPRFSTCTSYVCLLSPLITGMALLVWSCPRFITMELDWLNVSIPTLETCEYALKDTTCSCNVGCSSLRKEWW